MRVEQRSTESGIPFLDLGGKESGPLLVFSHANGYPPLCYRTLLEPLSCFGKLIAGQHRPLWGADQQPAELESWSTFSEDLIALLDSSATAPVVHLGHSMGAASGILAAARRPDLFKALVLIEPAIVSRRYLLLLRLFSSIAPDRIPLVRTTLNRTDRWASRQDAFEHFRPKRVFQNISDQALWDYVQHGTVEAADGGFQLTYSKQWEAHCYTRVHNLWQALSTLQVPALAIRGSDSDALFPGAWKKWQRLVPHHEFHVVEDAGHLLPLEKPLEIAALIEQWLEASGAIRPAP